MAGSYIPAPDADFNTWAVNFDTLLAANPTAYGETSGTAAPVTAAVGAWGAAYTLATDPSTRTPSTVADKDAARAAAEATIRPIANRINANALVTNMQRSDLGLTIRKTTRTPIPAPTTAPTVALVSAIKNSHTLQIRDEATPTSKAKPFGVIGCELWRSIGLTAATDPSQCTLARVTGKTPTNVSTDPADSGKVCTYFARWQTRSGPGGVAQTGPWSSVLSFNLM